MKVCKFWASGFWVMKIKKKMLSYEVNDMYYLGVFKTW